MRDLVIYGASFVDCVKLIDAINRSKPTWRIRGFVDDTPGWKGRSVLGHPVLGGQELLAALAREPQTDFFNNVRGTPQHCERIARRLREAGRESVSLAHPSVDLAYVKLGPGCTLADGCVVAARTRLGGYVTARIGCVISHDATIEDYVLLGPGVTIGSHVRIGARTLVGAGATVLTRVAIGAGALIGAGAVVTRPVGANVSVSGVPARAMSRPAGEAQRAAPPPPDPAPRAKGRGKAAGAKGARRSRK
jgi:sugar O-acyltransferase (sialic acid O-acetyltransferase NeuD family)